ncbi:MAG: FHA domain-containing protein, partial [Clostridiales bacterium]|nr:FHA domain-containing protein [Clostridiales bacterium]
MFEGFSLTIAEGGKKPADIQLADFGAGTVTFGRNAANDVVLDSPIASNFHGALVFEAGPGGSGDGDGGVYIIDKNSTNGIYVNGARVSGKARLRPGDAVTFESERARQAARGEHGAVMTLNASRAGAGPGVWSSAKIGGRPLTVGRDASCDIALSQASVSRLHARISAEGGRRFFIQDCGSTNGVYVNGARVSGRRELADRDAIFVGSARLVYAGGVVHYNVEQPSLPIEVAGARKTVLAKGRPRDILDGVSFSLAPNELAAIIGGSGAGKSTLMNGMCGFAPFTSGSVLFGGEDLRDNYGALKNLIGYVPQQDIVHRDLALRPMLLYTAEMRMPADSTAKDRESRVARAIETVELSGREDAQIKTLSGGQRKRASIAVELVSDPCAFFLDEPSSGLDPGTERHLMQMLKNMAGRGKTVVVVTHMTANIGLCDKLVILGTGGRLCFFGAPSEALAFFGVRDFADIYDKINDSPAQWKLRYEALHRPKAALRPQPQPGAGAHAVAGAQGGAGAHVATPGAGQAGAQGAMPGAWQTEAGAQGAAADAQGAAASAQWAPGAHGAANAHEAAPGARQPEILAAQAPGGGWITRAWEAQAGAQGAAADAQGAAPGAHGPAAGSPQPPQARAANSGGPGNLGSLGERSRAARPPRRGGNSAPRQFSVLCRRYAALVAADKRRLAL